MASDTDFETELNAEVSKRLTEMEDPNYEFPTRMKKSDFAIAGILMAICLVLVEVATQTAGVM